ncbi:MAG: hypothetical protein H6572_02250 [Lewinellaceae bacterium]|nr:hypothetical protein [Lewinellaceae bacterium]
MAGFDYSCTVASWAKILPPNYCGGSITVNYALFDQCGQADNLCYVVGSGNLTAICLIDNTLNACLTH